ncbi:MAG TPA: FHA domain-containing protein, partial [Ilumatobacteraceae bacterium]
MTHDWTFTWEAGPDAGGMATLSTGVHVVGRAAGTAVHCDDQALEPHHVLIDVGPDGATLRQLTGRAPVRVDGNALTGPALIGATTRVEIGHSVLIAAKGDLTAPGQGPDGGNVVVTPAGGVVIRGPRSAPRWSPRPVPRPADVAAIESVTGSVLPAVLALAGSSVVAVALDQPMFLIFGALGAIVALGTWGGQRLSVVSRGRRASRVGTQERAEFAAAIELQRAARVA